MKIMKFTRRYSFQLVITEVSVVEKCAINEPHPLHTWNILQDKSLLFTNNIIIDIVIILL